MLNVLNDTVWKNVVETMRDGLMLVDPDGYVIYVNKSFEKMTGYTCEELQDRGCEIFHCDRCYSTIGGGGIKECGLFDEENNSGGSVCVFKKKDGSSLHLLRNLSVIRDHQGAVVAGIETLVDIAGMDEKEKVISRLRRELHYHEGFQGIVGKSESMLRIFELAASAAQSDAPLIIHGESGTGKELLASAIHKNSTRREGPFIKLSCAALNEKLLESELFGHVKGAFNGADYTRIGRFEAANGGSIFLDEIGDLPLSTQTKLLRVLVDKEIERLGDDKPIKIDVRVIASTHKDLHHLIRQGTFKEGLYYRIGIIPIEMPPLRERESDILLLVESYIQSIRERTQKPIEGIAPEALELLMQYRWPGNVRELVNVIEYAFVICPGGQIDVEHLPGYLHQKLTESAHDSDNITNEYFNSRREQLIQALEKTGGNQSKAAKMLGVSRVTVWKWIKKYRIEMRAQATSQLP